MHVPLYDPLVDALRNARPGSQLAVKMALEAMAADGAAGSLTIHFPRKSTAPVEIEFHLRNGHPDLR